MRGATLPFWPAERLAPLFLDWPPQRKLRSRANLGAFPVDPEHETLTVYRFSSEGYVVAEAGGRADRIRAEPFQEIELEVALLFGSDGG